MFLQQVPCGLWCVLRDKYHRGRRQPQDYSGEGKPYRIRIKTEQVTKGPRNSRKTLAAFRESVPPKHTSGIANATVTSKR